MNLRTYGKINLFLNILGKREDGFHNIETVIQRIDLFDEIKLYVDKSFNGIDIKISCDKEGVPTDEGNLCYKACKWFMEKYRLNGKVFIDIKKNIPISAGLGGGTSNGAEIIKALNKIYNLNIDINVLCEDSVVLGADFPYCLIGGTILCEGVGERLKRINSFFNKIIIVVKPNFGFSTKDVYENFCIDNVKYNINKDEMIKYLNDKNFYGVCKTISNTLEYSNINGMDMIREIKFKLKSLGAINSSMSGSGSSVYGVFDNLYVAQKCYDDFKKEFNEVFITRTINK